MRPFVLAAVAVALAAVPPGAWAGTAAQERPATGATGTTGRLLVQLRDPGDRARTAARTATISRAGAGVDDRRVVPQIGALAVQPRAGQSLRSLARRLRADPGVASVRPERRFTLRYVPNDPALTAPDRGVTGTTAQWWAARLGLPAAWDITRGLGAKVAIIDSGVDAAHPELAPRILETADFDETKGHGPATVDESGHGTHVASLACAAADNGIGIAGAGLGCSLLIAKTDLSESSVAKAIVWAADRDADAINMSFGTDGVVAAAPSIVQALQYASARGSVLVAAAADDPIAEQGDPANVLQPTGSGADLNQNLGLSVTAADARDQRASFAGMGTQISLAAYGTYGSGGQQGILGAFPAQTTDLERGTGYPPVACRCRTTFGSDPRYAYLKGTSMAAPMVAGVAALARRLNPDLAPPDVVRILKQTARHTPGGAYSEELGWGIIDAGAALAVVRDTDRRAPVSVMAPAKVTGRSILLRWSATDAAPPGVASTGVLRTEIWRSANGRPARRLATTTGTSYRLRGQRGSRYTFWSVAVDHAGNRESLPAAARVRVRVTRR